MIAKLFDKVMSIIQNHKEQRIINKIKKQFIKDKREKAAIALVFNNRYTYRHKYIESKDILKGTVFITDRQTEGNAWMCPDCNRIHMSISCSVIDGLHYPACCGYSEGNRLFYNISI